MPYGDVVMVLSIVLRIKPTLDAAEIDKIIWDVEARRALAAEHRRRAEWRKAEVEADRFRAVCERLDVVQLHHVHEIGCSNRRIGRPADAPVPDDLESPGVQASGLCFNGRSQSRNYPGDNFVCYRHFVRNNDHAPMLVTDNQLSQLSVIPPPKQKI
jgi:hypothetical protein